MPSIHDSIFPYVWLYIFFRCGVVGDKTTNSFILACVLLKYRRLFYSLRPCRYFYFLSIRSISSFFWLLQVSHSARKRNWKPETCARSSSSWCSVERCPLNKSLSGCFVLENVEWRVLEWVERFRRVWISDCCYRIICRFADSFS